MESILFKPLSELSPDKKAAAIFTYIAFAIIIAFIAVAIVLISKKSDKLKKFLKYSLIGFTIYTLIVGITMLILTIKEDGFVPELAWPIIAIMASIIIGAIILFIISHKAPEKIKNARIIVISLVVVIAIVCGIILYSYYNKDIVTGGYYEVNQTALIISAVIMFLIPLLTIILKKENIQDNTRTIVFGAVCIAISFALSYLRLFKMPQGGSITLASLVPLMIYAYMFGVRNGVLAGMAYGVLQAIQDPYIIHPMQFLLDYPIAFSFIGFAGLFRNVKFFENKPWLGFVCGGIVASLFRFMSHVFSGVFAFSVYAEGQNPWLYSLGYNSFVFIDIVIALVVGALILSSRQMTDALKTYSPKQQ